ncbi:hypothetical protein HPP92_017729 [Vanilla planifolia]|uniref:Phytocyanin domain-containing protein n=1 Tax=Vanilla planifolia TaxID=51239 RepID=A0A835UQU7_VANPL|nr:hypothetical protein HPP92_017729 [Vanilla planifolia]
MASPLSILFLLLSACALLSCSADPVEFQVGGPLGWRKPTGTESETYNQWASRNRFHVGDSLCKLLSLLSCFTKNAYLNQYVTDFKYENDSVLLVDREDYASCNTANPVRQFTDGNTTFRFDRYGFFYFISGEPGHCLGGEKLIVRVMVHPEMGGTAPSPAPMPGMAVGPVPGAGFAGGPGLEPGSGTRSGNSGEAGSSGASRVGVGISLVGILAMVLSWQMV